MEASNSKIKSYFLENFGLKVSSADITQTKCRCGIEARKNYHLSKRDSYKTPICTAEKEKAINEAIKYLYLRYPVEKTKQALRDFHGIHTIMQDRSHDSSQIS